MRPSDARNSWPTPMPAKRDCTRMRRERQHLGDERFEVRPSPRGPDLQVEPFPAVPDLRGDRLEDEGERKARRSTGSPRARRRGRSRSSAVSEPPVCGPARTSFLSSRCARSRLRRGWRSEREARRRRGGGRSARARCPSTGRRGRTSRARGAPAAARTSPRRRTSSKAGGSSVPRSASGERSSPASRSRARPPVPLGPASARPPDKRDCRLRGPGPGRSRKPREASPTEAAPPRRCWRAAWPRSEGPRRRGRA